MITPRNAKLITMVAAVAVALALPAWARGPGGTQGGASRPASPRVTHARGLLGQLVYPCQTACVTDAGSCNEAAQSAGLACVSDSCAAEVEAAQTPCAEERSSDECKAATDALAVCADACLATYSTAVSSCRATLSECRAACEE